MHREQIMLRNIPNKMTSVCHLYLSCCMKLTSQAVLQEILNETSFGKYDFTYLRIGRLPSKVA